MVDAVSEFTPEERAEMVRMKYDPNLYQNLVRSMAPTVFGHEEVKRVRCCLSVLNCRSCLALVDGSFGRVCCYKCAAAFIRARRRCGSASPGR